MLETPAFDHECAELAERAGQIAIHVRTPGLQGAAQLLALLRVRRVEGLTVVVNDRVDVALAGDAHGVHLAQHSMDAASARGLLGPGRLLGASVHSAEEAGADRVAEVDFLFVGSVYPTPSHPELAPRGIGLLGEVASVHPAPAIAIGGISPHHVEVLCSEGAHGVAVRSGVWGQPNPVAAAQAYLDVLPTQGHDSPTSLNS